MKIMLVRSTGMNPTPRVDKTAQYLDTGEHRIRIVGWDRKLDAPDIERRGENIDVVRLRLSGSYGAGGKNIVRLLVFQMYIFWNMIKFAPDVVHAYDLDTAFTAWMYCKLFRKKLVFDICDMYYSSRKTPVLLRRPLYLLECFIAAVADKTILCHERRLELYRVFSSRIKQRVTVIYNTPKEVDEEQLERYQIPAADIAYVGVLQNDRSIEELCIIAARHGIRVNIAGFGALASVVKHFGEQHDNIRFFDEVPYEKGLAIQKSAKYIWAVYNEILVNNKYAAPNKLFEGMMLGVPLITCSGTIMDEVVLANRLGVVLSSSCPEIMEREIMDLLSSDVAFSANEMREFYKNGYNFSSMSSRMNALYNSI